MARKPGRAAEARRIAGERGWSRIGEEEWGELAALLAPVTEDALRRAAREAGLPLAPWVEGVRQGDFEELRRTLEALAEEYEAAAAAGDAERARRCRRLVLRAKDRAKLAARAARDEGRSKEKREMADWMLVWLETPALFRQWSALRVRARGERDPSGKDASSTGV